MPDLFKSLLKFLSTFLNQRGETLIGEGDGEGDPAPEGGDGVPAVPAATEPTVDWESDANPYRKRYGDSQGQIQPLVRTLSQFAEYDHTTKTWKPKAPAAPAISSGDDFEKVLEGYDPEFRKAMTGYTQKQIKAAIAEFRQESTFMTEYNSQIQSSRNRALEEFGGEFELAKGGKFNTESPLYKLANEILTSKYAQFNPDGTFHKYATPEAEYMATVEAYAIMAKRAKQPAPDKGKLGAIQGKGTKAAGVKGKLSYEEYSKLNSEAKDAYDLAQIV